MKDRSAAKQPLEAVLDETLEQAEAKTVAIGDIVDAFEGRSFGPFFILAGLLALIPPVGAIPGLPAAVGAAAAILAVEMLLGRRRIWLPRAINSMAVKRSLIETARDKAAPVLAAIDRPVTKRFTWMTDGAGRRVAAAFALFLSLLLIPMELAPFAVALPAAGLCAVGVALVAHDGALMMAAYAVCTVSVAVMLSVVL